MIHVLSGYEEIESGVEPFEVRILRDQRVNLLHVRGIFELGNLNPELLISSQVYRRWKTTPPNFADTSFRRRSSSDRHPASSNSFIMGLRAWMKASAFRLGTR